MDSDIKQTFKDQVNQSEQDVNLLYAALLIGIDEYPELDTKKYLGLLDEWAEEIKDTLEENAGTDAILQALNDLMFQQKGFSGSSTNYYDPRNSYINEVLERRTGIPLSLSIIYIELGRRLGLDIRGVSFPGHFLVKVPFADGEVVLDPYNQGISLSPEALLTRLNDMLDTESGTENLAPFLQAASKKDILVRMLSNLKGIYQQQGDSSRTLDIITRILLVNPAMVNEYRDRGLLLNSLECHNAALSDLQYYLSATPDGGDIIAIRNLVIDLQENHNHLH